MWTKIKNLASLYRELGRRWTLFRLAYAFRLRTGLIRLQMPMGEWSDYKNRISENPAGRVAHVFFAGVSRPSELSENVSWNKQATIDEANRILKGELKYFAHEFIKTGFSPNWHKDPISGID